MNEYVVLPEHGAKHVVIACHGSGRKAESYIEVPFYAKQRDIALNSGCAFAAVDMGQDTYGTQRGLEILDAFYLKLIREYDFDAKAAFWASSAGGSVMFNYARRHPERVGLLLGTFPIWDLDKETHLRSMRAVWGVEEGQKVPNEFNSALHADELPNVPIVIAQGKNDRAVPADDNALALKQLLGDRVTLFITDDEHSTQAFGLYETDIYSNALSRFKEGK